MSTLIASSASEPNAIKKWLKFLGWLGSPAFVLLVALVSKPTGGEALRTKGGAQQYDSPDPWVGGTFHFETLIMPPLTKTCPKMVLSIKG